MFIVERTIVHRYCLLVVLFLILNPQTKAQETEWKFQEQCAAYATSNLEFHGTILATGYGGLHGINANWETPRIVARINRYSDGRLSPDQRWYAEVLENVIYAESFNDEHVIENIRVSSTLGDSTVYVIPWQNSWLQMWGYREFFWINNDHILYEFSDNFVHDLEELVSVNPFENTVVQWNASIDILDGGSGFQHQYIQFPSPDFTKTVYFPSLYQDHFALYDVSSGELVSKLPSMADAVVAWQPDSSAFALEITTNDNQTELVIYDSEGNFIESLFELGSYRIHTPENIRWSYNSQYLAFRPASRTLLIADTKSQSVLDTCLTTGTGFSWSPDGTQIAFLEPGSGIQGVTVFDLPTWTYRIVARHIVQTDFWDKVIGWRED